MGYYGFNPWCDVAKKLMGKYECPEHLVPAPPKTPEEVGNQLLGKCKAPWKLPEHCSAMFTNMPKL